MELVFEKQNHEICIYRKGILRRLFKVHRIVQNFVVFQKICSVLWFLTNQHETINNTASKRKKVIPIPSCFSLFQGYNEVKRKKLKSQPLDVGSLDTHLQLLYGFVLFLVLIDIWKIGENKTRLRD